MNISGILLAMQGAVSQGVLWGIMVLGVYITYKILDIADLTVDGSFALGGCVCAILVVEKGVDPVLALIIATVAGMIAGGVTGALHTIFDIPAILAGILTQIGLWSINLRIMGGKANVALSANKYDLLVTLRNVRKLSFDNPILLLVIFTAAIIVLLYLFFGTEYGSAMRATGSNANMSRAQGINTDFAKVVGLMLSNGIVALSGALLAQYQGFADVSMGRGAIVVGLAAVIIGEVVFGKLFRSFAGKLLAVSLGAVIYYIVMQVVLWLGLNTNDLKMLTALVVAMFLAIPFWKGKIAASRLSKGGKANA